MLRGPVPPVAPSAGRGGRGVPDVPNRVPYCAPRAWGVPPPPDFAGVWVGGMATKDICARYGVSKDRLTSWRKALRLPPRAIGKPRRGWPSWRRQAFKAAWRRGDSGKAMAERFGLTVRAVFALRAEFRLPPRWPACDNPVPPPAEAAAPPARLVAGSFAVSVPAEGRTGGQPERVRECRFVSGPPWLYCEEPTERGRSMCEAHRARCLARAAA